ncbi:MAG: HIT domain-containing protein [Vicinamibacteria bacterium]
MGEAACQTVFHLHVHLIPRQAGCPAAPRLPLRMPSGRMCAASGNSALPRCR